MRTVLRTRSAWMSAVLLACAIGVSAPAVARAGQSTQVDPGVAAATATTPSGVASAQGGLPPVVAVAQVAAIHVAAGLTDAVWQTAEVATAFVQREPTEGAPPTFRTEARVAYDTTTLYVAVHAFDPQPEKIISFLTRRDTESASDWIRVMIDSYHDRRTAYEFAVNPLGVKQDTYRFNDGDSDGSWDAVWDVAVGRDPDGWHAEFRIPLSQLRFARNGSERIGFAVVREIARLNEITTWPLLARSASGYVSSFGELTGVGASPVSKRLEILPYAVGQVITQPHLVGNPLENRVDRKGSVGVDVKYAVTPALNLTATVNPDFGQVEADPATVNLGAFETFFDERRPFFVEGSGTYRFGVNCIDAPCSLFYSRRIGRQPRGSAITPEGGYALQPLQSTILGAAKLTGRVGKFSVGALSAFTQEENAQIAFGAARTTQVIEPQTAYSVARLRREYDDQSSLGFMLTSVNRRSDEAVSFLPDTAVAGAVDFEWRIRKRYNVEGYWMGSTVHGSTTAITALQTNNVHGFQRPDADYLEVDPLAQSLNGHHASVAFNKLAGRLVRFNANVAYKTPGFDINDLGFLRRADEINQSNWLQLKFETPGRYVRSLNVNFNQWTSHNFAGERQLGGGNVNAHWRFQNFWGAGTGVNFSGRTFDDRLTRGGPGGYVNGFVNSWQYLNTDDRKVVGGNWNSFMRSDLQGSTVWNVEPHLVIRPVSSASIEVGLFYERNTNQSQWVGAVIAADSTHYAFGRLGQTTSAITLRGNYTLTPRLSLQLYAQPFVSSGDYSRYKELVDGHADSDADRYQPYAYDGSADFRVLSFRTTNVVRWEFKPGSTLFVVWQQGREGNDHTGDFRFSRDFRDTFSTAATSTFLVKFAYWLNP